MKIRTSKLRRNARAKLKSPLKFIQKYLTLIIIAVVFLFLYACDNWGLSTGTFIMDNLKSISTNFTPTTDLFDDGSEVSFVSYFFGMNVPKKNDTAHFILPTFQQNISDDDESLCFEYEGVVASISSGTVSTVGYTATGEKYVEIENKEGYCSRYIGLSFVGVSTGIGVSGGDKIGLVSSEKKLRVYVFQNGESVEISDIEWEN